MDWELVLNRRVQPKFVPHLESMTDLSNIDRFFTREEPVETPTEDSVWLKKERFDQFTYLKDDSIIELPEEQSPSKDEKSPSEAPESLLQGRSFEDASSLLE